MPITPPQPVTIIPPGQANPGNVKAAASQLRKTPGQYAAIWAAIGDALANLQRQSDHAYSALQSPLPFPNPLQITAADGSLIAVIGSIIDPATNAAFSGIWTNHLWVGGGGPASAPFFVSGSQVFIGQNGQVFILDAAGNVVGWFGVSQDSPALAVTLATNASPSVLTVPGNTYVAGDTTIIAGALGNTAINGYRIIQDIGIAGAGTFTLTTLAGAPVNGNGAYTASSATSTRYYAGILSQTIAIGQSFANYKLRAFADGSLKIKDAYVNIAGSGGIIAIDPVQGKITVTSTAAAGSVVTIQDGIAIADGSGVDNQIQILEGVYTAFHDAIAAIASSIMADYSGYTGATQYGPLVSLTQYRGTPSAATASQSGDTLGGLIAKGYDGTGESDYCAGVRAVATENHAVAAHGTKLVIEVTKIGNASPFTALELSEGVVSTYNGAAAAGSGLVPVYAAIHLTAQTTSIGTSNLRVGGVKAPAGLYRVSVYVKTTTASGTDTLTVTIGWNDGAAARSTTVTIQLSTTGAGGFGSGQIPVEADGVNDITYATTRTGATGTPQYSLRVVLEQLTLT
jgi:hypothetical protein